jgi:hypothetical protein
VAALAVGWRHAQELGVRAAALLVFQAVGSVARFAQIAGLREDEGRAKRVRSHETQPQTVQDKDGEADAETNGGENENKRRRTRRLLGLELLATPEWTLAEVISFASAGAEKRTARVARRTSFVATISVEPFFYTTSFFEF